MRVSAALPVALALVAGVIALPQAAAQDDVPTDPGDVPVEAGVAPGAGVPDMRPGEAFADPRVAELQGTATDVQRELNDLSGRIGKAREALVDATKELSAARAAREAAEARVAAQQADVDALSSSAYMLRGRPNDFTVMLTAEGPDEYLAASEVITYLRNRQDERLTSALTRHRKAVAAERKALGLEEQANERKADLDRRNGDATNRADAISSELRGPIDLANAAVLAQQAAQKKRNARTAKNWKAYVRRLKDAGVTPPHAGSLRDPAHLPGGLKPLMGANGKPQAGVAQAVVAGKRILVLPKETIEAVTAAVGALGKPYVPREHGEGPTSYSCDGLVKSVFGRADLEQPDRASEQFAVGKPISPKDVRAGDLVFVGPDKYGVQHVGISLDDKTMVAADGRLASVAVTDSPVGDSLVGVTRPALGKGEARKKPRRAKGELTWRCGGVELPVNLGATGPAAGAAGAWGGYPNGLIPPSALCGVGVGSHALRCDAAQAFVAISRAYGAATGGGLCITDSYRTFAAQVDLYRRKPSLAAVPGTSNHGWGIAIDMCGGVESFGTSAYRWMAQNGPRFGWINPYWARPGGGREEPWHWEYIGRY